MTIETAEQQGKIFHLRWNWETPAVILREGRISKLEVGDTLEIVGFYDAGKHEFADDAAWALNYIASGLKEQIQEYPDLRANVYEHTVNLKEGSCRIRRVR